jgi:hypothetical protein
MDVQAAHAAAVLIRAPERPLFQLPSRRTNRITLIRSLRSAARKQPRVTYAGSAYSALQLYTSRRVADWQLKRQRGSRPDYMENNETQRIAAAARGPSTHSV